MPRIRIVAISVVAVLLATLSPAVSAKVGHKAKDATVENPDDGTKIAITVFVPSGASASSPAPVILHSHGWAGSRATAVADVKPFLDAGLGVVSIDQRGHGESEGQANVQDPEMETEDVQAVIDYVATLDWVALDGPGDPVLGAIGGSYGGGYQTMTALDEIHETGRTRFNALAPEITWYDLPQSLAPQGVPRTAWTTLLYAVGAPMVPQYIHESFYWGAATGQWPDGTLYGQKVPYAPNIDTEFTRHSPIWYAQRNIAIDVPVLQRQGISDNLFPLNEGLGIFHNAVTPGARAQSYFIGYNGGHALPNALPAGTASGEDACSPKGNFTKLSIEFFSRVFGGQSTAGLLPARYNLTTADGSRCIRTSSLPGLRAATVDPTGYGSVIATAGLGAPIHIPIAEGPLSVAGIPTLTGKMSAAGIDTRAFFGLSIGSTPADARVIQNNLMPLHAMLPVQDKKFSVDLAGVAVDVPNGQTLFIAISPVSDLSFGHSSRTPGGFVLSGLKVLLPSFKD